MFILISRLRGLKYLTWEKINKLTSLEAEGSPYSGPAHQKFRSVIKGTVCQILSDPPLKKKMSNSQSQSLNWVDSLELKRRELKPTT